MDCTWFISGCSFCGLMITIIFFFFPLYLEQYQQQQYGQPQYPPPQQQQFPQQHPPNPYGAAPGIIILSFVVVCLHIFLHSKQPTVLHHFQDKVICVHLLKQFVFILKNQYFACFHCVKLFVFVLNK
jgi:hypothetical protein